MILLSSMALVSTFHTSHPSLLFLNYVFFKLFFIIVLLSSDYILLLYEFYKYMNYN